MRLVGKDASLLKLLKLLRLRGVCELTATQRLRVGLLLRGILETGALRGHVHQALLFGTASRRDAKPRVGQLPVELIHRGLPSRIALPDTLIGQPRFHCGTVALQLRVHPLVHRLLDALPVLTEIPRAIGPRDVATIAKPELLRAVIAETALLLTDIGYIGIGIAKRLQPIMGGPRCGRAAGRPSL